MSEISVMIDRLLNARPDASCSQVLRQAAGLLREIEFTREQQAHGVPEGYALVPIESTPAMHLAAESALRDNGAECPNVSDGKAVWKAMLAAAKGEE